MQRIIIVCAAALLAAGQAKAQVLPGDFPPLDTSEAYDRYLNAMFESETVLYDYTVTDRNPRVMATVIALGVYADKNPLATEAQLTAFANAYDGEIMARVPEDPDLVRPANLFRAVRYNVDIGTITDPVVVAALAGTDTNVAVEATQFLGIRRNFLDDRFAETYIEERTRNIELTSMLATAFNPAFGDVLIGALQGVDISGGDSHPAIEGAMEGYLAARGYGIFAHELPEYQDIWSEICALPDFETFDDERDIPGGFAGIFAELDARLIDWCAEINTKIGEIALRTETLDDTLANPMAGLAQYEADLRGIARRRAGAAFRYRLAATSQADDARERAKNWRHVSMAAAEVDHAAVAGNAAFTIGSGFAEGGQGGGAVAIASVGFNLLSTYAGFPDIFGLGDNESELLAGLMVLQEAINQLGMAMTDRFNAVDAKLNGLYDTVEMGFIDVLDAVETNRATLTAQTVQLHRLEDRLFDVLLEGRMLMLLGHINMAIDDPLRGLRLEYGPGVDSFQGYHGTFRNFATIEADSTLLAPDLGPGTWNLATASAWTADVSGSINGLVRIACELGSPIVPCNMPCSDANCPDLVNPTGWAPAADGYGELFRENPWYAAFFNGDYSAVLARGYEVRDAVRNARDSDLFATLEGLYVDRTIALHDKLYNKDNESSIMRWYLRNTLPQPQEDEFGQALEPEYVPDIYTLDPALPINRLLPSITWECSDTHSDSIGCDIDIGGCSLVTFGPVTWDSPTLERWGDPVANLYHLGGLQLTSNNTRYQFLKRDDSEQLFLDGVADGWVYFQINPGGGAPVGYAFMQIDMAVWEYNFVVRESAGVPAYMAFGDVSGSISEDPEDWQVFNRIMEHAEGYLNSTSDVPFPPATGTTLCEIGGPDPQFEVDFVGCTDGCDFNYAAPTGRLIEMREEFAELVAIVTEARLPQGRFASHPELQTKIDEVKEFLDDKDLFGAMDHFEVNDVVALMDAYLSLGLPQTMDTNQFLRAAVRGGVAGDDGTFGDLALGPIGIRAYLNLVADTQPHASPNLAGDMADRLDAVSTVWDDFLVEDPALDPGGAEHHTYLSWAISSVEAAQRDMLRLAVDDTITRPACSGMGTVDPIPFADLLANDVDQDGDTPLSGSVMRSVVLVDQPSTITVVNDEIHWDGECADLDAGVSFTYEVHGALVTEGGTTLATAVSNLATVVIKGGINAVEPTEDCNGNLTEDLAEVAMPTAISLPDAGARLRVTNFAGMPSDAFTVEMWFKSTGVAESLFSYASSGGSSNEILLIRDSATLLLYVKGVLLDTGLAFDELTSQAWHHLAVSWVHATGRVNVYVDGRRVFNGNHPPVDPISDGGCLVIGEDQDSLCGSFSAGQAFVGDIRQVRLWGVERSASEIYGDYDKPLLQPLTEPGLVSYWPMSQGSGMIATDLRGGNDLDLTAGSSDAVWTSVLGTNEGGNCALAECRDCNDNRTPDALELAMPTAISLLDTGDRLQLVPAAAQGMPSDAFTIEMWLRRSMDVPTEMFFSYAVVIDDFFGTVEDNEILIERAGTLRLHVKGAVLDTGVAFDELDSNAWHHLTVSWRSDIGRVNVYIDGCQVFAGTHAQGSLIEDGGCLVIGEDQDVTTPFALCEGFDPTQTFIGDIRQVRLWGVERRASAILANYARPLSGNEPGLVSYWPMDEGSNVVALDVAGLNSLALIPLGPSGPQWTSVDADDNGVPDDCVNCRCDVVVLPMFPGVDVFDLLHYLAELWFPLDPAAEFNCVEGIDIFDLLAYLGCWFPAANEGLCP